MTNNLKPAAPNQSPPPVTDGTAVRRRRFILPIMLASYGLKASVIGLVVVLLIGAVSSAINGAGDRPCLSRSMRGSLIRPGSWRLGNIRAQQHL